MSLPSILLRTSSRSYFVRFARNVLSTAATGQTPSALGEPAVFQHAKSEKLFQRITAKCSKEDVTLLAHAIQQQLGRTYRPSEFYYSGLGGGRKGGAAGEAAAEAPKEEKTSFDLQLVGFDAKAKIKIIKEVRTIAGLGLKEAKEMVEGAPKIISKGLKKEQADEMKARLEELGAQMKLV